MHHGRILRSAAPRRSIRKRRWSGPAAGRPARLEACLADRPTLLHAARARRSMCEWSRNSSLPGSGPGPSCPGTTRTWASPAGSARNGGQGLSGAFGPARLSLMEARLPMPPRQTQSQGPAPYPALLHELYKRLAQRAAHPVTSSASSLLPVRPHARPRQPPDASPQFPPACSGNVLQDLAQGMRDSPPRLFVRPARRMRASSGAECAGGHEAGAWSGQEQQRPLSTRNLKGRRERGHRLVDAAGVGSATALPPTLPPPVTRCPVCALLWLS